MIYQRTLKSPRISKKTAAAGRLESLLLIYIKHKLVQDLRSLPANDSYGFVQNHEYCIKNSVFSW